MAPYLLPTPDLWEPWQPAQLIKGSHIFEFTPCYGVTHFKTRERRYLDFAMRACLQADKVDELGSCTRHTNSGENGCPFLGAGSMGGGAGWWLCSRVCSQGALLPTNPYSDPSEKDCSLQMNSPSEPGNEGRHPHNSCVCLPEPLAGFVREVL